MKQYSTGKISPENAAKRIVIIASRILRQQDYTREQIIKFGAGVASEVLAATMEMVKTCKEKGGEEDE